MKPTFRERLFAWLFENLFLPLEFVLVVAVGYAVWWLFGRR